MSNFVEDIANELKTTLEGMPVDLAPKVKVWSEPQITSSPMVVITPPFFDWPGDSWTDGSQLGSYQWNLSYLVYLYVTLQVNAQKAQSAATQYVIEMAKTIQRDPTLNGSCDTAKMMEANLELENDPALPYLLYECKVDVEVQIANEA